MRCSGHSLLGAASMKEVTDQSPHRFLWFVTNSPTFKKSVNDLKSSTEVRQRELIELSPTLQKAERGDKTNK